MSLATLRQWRRRWAKWYVSEQDLRSYTARNGWLHALAHGADVAAVFARHPALTREDMNRILDTLLKRISRVKELPSQYEDDRLALAAYLLLIRPEVSHVDRLRWLVRLRWQLLPTYGKPRPAATAFAVQTARALLMFTHFGARLPDGTTLPASAEWQGPLLEALKSAFHYAYPE